MSLPGLGPRPPKKAPTTVYPDPPRQPPTILRPRVNPDAISITIPRTTQAIAVPRLTSEATKAVIVNTAPRTNIGVGLSIVRPGAHSISLAIPSTGPKIVAATGNYASLSHHVGGGGRAEGEAGATTSKRFPATNLASSRAVPATSTYTINPVTGKYHISQSPLRKDRQVTVDEDESLMTTEVVIVTEDMIDTGGGRVNNPSPKTLRDLVVHTAVSDPLKNNSVEILLGGDLVIVGQLTFAIREGLALLDCPVCKRAVGLVLLASHLYEEHKLSRVDCFAGTCGTKAIPGTQLLKHLLCDHGAFVCPDCSRSIFVHETKEHMDSQCKRVVPKSTIPSLRMPLPMDISSFSGEKTDLLKEEEADGYCLYCNDSVPNLRDHLRSRHQPKVRCRICHDYVPRCDFDLHLAENGDHTRKKTCFVCQAHVDNLKLHLRRTHSLGWEEADQEY